MTATSLVTHPNTGNNLRLEPTIVDVETDPLADEAMAAAIMLQEDVTTCINLGWVLADSCVARPAIVGEHITFNNHITVTLICRGCKNPDVIAWWLGEQFSEHFRWVAGGHLLEERIAYAMYEYLGGEETDVDDVSESGAASE